MNKEQLYAKRKALVKHCWEQYQVKKDPRWLAEICDNLPFFEYPEVGAEISRRLSKNFHKVNKIDDQTMRSEIKKLWEIWENTDTDRAIYQRIASIYFGDDKASEDRVRKIVGK